MEWNTQNLCESKPHSILFLLGLNLRFSIGGNPNKVLLELTFNKGSGYIKSEKHIDTQIVTFFQLYKPLEKEYVNPCNSSMITIPIPEIRNIKLNITDVPMVHYFFIEENHTFEKVSQNHTFDKTFSKSSKCIGKFMGFKDNNDIYRYLFKTIKGQQILHNFLLPMWDGKHKCMTNRIKYQLPYYHNYKGKNPVQWFKMLIDYSSCGWHLWDIVNGMEHPNTTMGGFSIKCEYECEGNDIDIPLYNKD